MKPSYTHTGVRPRHRARTLAGVVTAVLLASACTANGGGGTAGDKGSASSSSNGSSGPPAKSSGSPDRTTFPKGIFYGAKFEQPGLNEYSATGHQAQGFENDLAQFVAAKLGSSLTAVDTTSKERETFLADHADGLVIATYSITDKRKKLVAFAGPYLNTRQGVLIRASDKKKIRKREDLTGKAVCTAEGSTSDADDQRTLLNGKAEYVPRDDYKRCVDDLLNGNVDAVWTDKVILYGFVERHGVKLMVPEAIEVGAPQKYGIGLPLAQPERCRQLVTVLKDFLADKWRVSFQSHFPHLVKRVPDFEARFKPKPETLALNSCDSP
ncbi:transporter substrate-binding domain-containing protein [Streptomyces sp. NBC_00237]|uniref:transporter substrate-binding domain-containing protein n=1 Tax=Streptomyces sp. NBC_00237 TaxID=2975687 RepID=UPI00224D16D4|nr:transporter substrate-binding domain-containing protein [Streptomyces sp. NBC_00237]MCX5204691.1 transporter substrate-binding domain-containing protein [Streptomyces sp. NBC_00237]